MVKELEQARESKEELLPHDHQVMIDSINRLVRQADRKKLECIYCFILNIL